MFLYNLVAENFFIKITLTLIFIHAAHRNVSDKFALKSNYLDKTTIRIDSILRGQ